MHDSLIKFESKPPKYETLSDLFRNIKKEHSKTTHENEKSDVAYDGFKTAKEMMDEEKLNSFTAECEQEELKNDIFEGIKTAKEIMDTNLKNAVNDKAITSKLGNLFGDESDEDAKSTITNNLEMEYEEFESFVKNEVGEKVEEVTQNKTQGNTNKRKPEKTHGSERKKIMKIDNVKEKDVKKETKDTKCKLGKVKIGSLVVKLLTPAYVEKRFDSKDTFKILARNISHSLHDKGLY